MDPLFTLAPEMTSRSCLYTLQFYLFSALISGGRPSSMIFPLYFPLPGRFHGGGNPPCPPRNGYFQPRGGRRSPSSSPQSRCYSAGRRGQHWTRSSRKHQRRPAHRLRPDSSSQGSMCLMSQLHRCRFQFPATPGHSQTLWHIRSAFAAS